MNLAAAAGGGGRKKTLQPQTEKSPPLRRENGEIYYELIDGYWLIIISGRLTGACPTAATTNTFCSQVVALLL